MDAPKSSPFVSDILIDHRAPNGGEDKDDPCYGPEQIKRLANYGGVKSGLGYWTQRNADSYAWFAMAKYIEKEIGQ